MNYNLLKVFIKVAEFKSFTKAATQLNQPKSRVSRSIARLEDDLKIQLIKRSTRSISLTEAGLKLYQQTHQIFHQLEKRIEKITDGQFVVSGTLSISAPLDFGESILPNLLDEFAKIHPDVTFKVLLSDSYVDLTALDIDVALRVGKLKDSSLKQKKLTDTQLILVASKDYLSINSTPTSWKEIQKHKLLSFYNENHQDPLKKICQTHNIAPAISINSFPMIKQLVLDSKGIGLLPNTLCYKELRNAELVRVLPQWGHQKSPLQVVFSSSKNLPRKTRAFLDFLTEKKTILFN